MVLFCLHILIFLFFQKIAVIKYKTIIQETRERVFMVEKTSGGSNIWFSYKYQKLLHAIARKQTNMLAECGTKWEAMKELKLILLSISVQCVPDGL